MGSSPTPPTISEYRMNPEQLEGKLKRANDALSKAIRQRNKLFLKYLEDATFWDRYQEAEDRLVDAEDVVDALHSERKHLIEAFSKNLKEANFELREARQAAYLLKIKTAKIQFDLHHLLTMK